jgi:mannosyl-3-phosphoglycerate phosphatase
VIEIYIIFTDLDGTLLDGNYSFQDALPALNILKEKKTPIIFCSGKTRVEQEVFKNKMEISHPFIVEDGSAIYIPKGYFKEKQGDVSGDYEVIVLGTEFDEIRKNISSLSEKYRIESYHTMSDEEVAKRTGLSLNAAKLAKTREFSETVVSADKEALEALAKDFNVVLGGRFMHVYGKGADKGKAIEILTNIYRKLEDTAATRTPMSQCLGL